MSNAPCQELCRKLKYTMQEDIICKKMNKKAHIDACLYVDKLKNIQQEGDRH